MLQHELFATIAVKRDLHTQLKAYCKQHGCKTYAVMDAALRDWFATKPEEPLSSTQFKHLGNPRRPPKPQKKY